MTVEGVFRKVFGRKGLGGAGDGGSFAETQLHPAMAAELQRLDLFKPGLGKLGQAFVATAKPEGFLDMLGSIASSYPQTSYSSPYLKDNAAVNDAQSKVDVALVKGEIPASPAIARFIAVRRLVRPMVTQPGWGRQSYPESQMPTRELFSALLQGEGRLNSHSYHIQPPPPLVPTISPHAILVLLNQTSGDETDYFELALIHSRHDRMAGHAEFAQMVAAQPDRFAAAFERLRDGSHVRAIGLVERLGLLTLQPILAHVVTLLGKGHGKDVRKAAVAALAHLDPGQLLALLQRELDTAELEVRFGLVEAAGQARTPEILGVLAKRAKIEKAAKIKSAIQIVLENGANDETSDDESAQVGVTSYTAVDGEVIALPTRIDLGSDEVFPPTDESCSAFVKLVEKIEIAQRERHAEYLAKYPSRNPTPQPQPFACDVIEASFAAMTEARQLPAGMPSNLIERVCAHPDGQDWFRQVLAQHSTKAGLRLLTAAGCLDHSVLIGDGYAHSLRIRFGVEVIREWLEEERLDLRDVAGADALRSILGRGLSYNRRDPNAWIALEELPRDRVWPWAADNMVVYDEALGLQATNRQVAIENALEGLDLLPGVPQRYLPKLIEIALTGKRPHRRQILELLRDAREVPSRLEALLDDKRQQVRINAAVWLADIRATASEQALRRRLKKEKSDPVRAALIESLQRMGFDLSDVIGPATLVAEAEAARAKAAPELPGWLVAHGIPAAHFRDGSTVPPLLVKHWLALAIRLKDPAASGQFGIYLDQLDPADARALSNWVIDSWISYDTASASLEEATAYALANYQNNFNWAYVSSKTPELREQVITQIVREKTGEIVNSGSDTKGILALACRADPVFAANRVRWFLKKHGRRSNQAIALLEVLAGIGQPAALQVVIAASARLKQKSTQARAAEIAERYAEDRGWSFDELADRTVPTAGFDDDGLMELPCGDDEKLYTARLDAMLAIHLFNPDGKAVKSLPAGDDEVSKDSKKAFTAAKRELAQVIELQGTRLFEAMCVERAWPVADWRLAFHEHPVMRRLVERLVWQGLDAEGSALGLFRPTQEGDFTDANDNPVEIDSFAKVRLAHGALVDEATCAAWVRHLKDYEVKPFLAQFDTLRAPLSAEQGEAEAIVDRQGWKAESLTFRGASEKRGYQRIMRDGGGCNEYEKTFASHRITATIFHTGSAAQDDNNPVALKELRFAKQGHRGTCRLKDVPPVMLAECWADYHAVAAKGAFDPEWEKIAPW